jgi:DNA-binding LacI/PurR family transcriptional regulator
VNRKEGKWMASIREVAKRAGVSPATVSRVINGTARVDEEKRERVEKAIEETGFRPNELARALYRKSSKIIGVIVPDIENPFFSELAKAIEKEAYEQEYRILLCNSDDQKEKELANLQMLAQLQADGVILMTNTGEKSQSYEAVSMPIVFVDRRLDEMGQTSVIEADHYAGGKLAAEHLIACGCRKITCIRGPQELSSGKKRYEGYREVCRQYSMKERFVDSTYKYEDGAKAAEEVLRRYPDTDGIIACNDMTAVSVYKVLQKRGYRVPDDIQIIGFDGVKFGRFLTPELTTVAQPIKEMGKCAVQMILGTVKELPRDREMKFPMMLIKGETTKNKM